MVPSYPGAVPGYLGGVLWYLGTWYLGTKVLSLVQIQSLYFFFGFAGFEPPLLVDAVVSSELNLARTSMPLKQDQQSLFC